jgi:hypothetical protein
MENDNEAQHTPHAEWGSLTGWEMIVFQVEDDPERTEGRRQTAEVATTSAPAITV